MANRRGDDLWSVPNPAELRREDGVRIIRVSGGWLSAEVPDEADSLALVLIRPEPGDMYAVYIAGELIDQQPEMVTAAMQMAFLEMRKLRRAAHERIE